MAKLTYEQRIANLERGRATAAANRARKRAAASSPSPLPPTTPGGTVPAGDTVVPPGGADDLEVEVSVDTTPKPKASLKDRFLGVVQSKGTGSGSSTKRPAKKGDNLMVKLVPTLVASFIATYSYNLFKEEYKACAPTKNECDAVLAPLFAIIGRRLEVYGKVSQDAVDLSNAIICGLAYGTRAYVTYVQIKHEKEKPGYGEEQRRAYREKLEREAREYEAVVSGGPGAHQSASPSVDRPGTGSPGGRGGDVHGEHGLPDDPDGDTGDRGAEAALVADLFARDRNGRVRLGLLPA